MATDAVIYPTSPIAVSALAAWPSPTAVARPLLEQVQSIPGMAVSTAIGSAKTAQDRAEARAPEMELIREAQSGSRAAFDALVRQYEHQVLRLALHLTGSEHDAEDIYQEAFLKAYRYIGNFRFECSFYTWIYRIVTNLCLDQLRRKKTRREDHAVVMDHSGDEIDLLASVSRQAHPARKNGLRAQALPGSPPAHHRRNVEHHGRDRQKHPLPCHQKTSHPIGGIAFNLVPRVVVQESRREP